MVDYMVHEELKMLGDQGKIKSIWLLTPTSEFDFNWPQINSVWKFRRHPPTFHPLQRGQSIKYFPEVNQYAYDKINDDMSKYINTVNKVLLTFCPLISKMFKKVERNCLPFMRLF